MAQLTLIGKNPTLIKTDAIVFGVAKGADGIEIVGEQVPDCLGRYAASADALGITGAPDEVKRFPTCDAVKADVVVLVGLGEPGDDGFDAETLRRAAGAAIRSLAGTASAAIALPTTSADDVAAVAEGALLGAYSFTAHRSDEEAAAKSAPVATIELVTSLSRSERSKTAAERAQVVAAAVCGARDLVNTPPNVLYPAEFAAIAKACAKDLKNVKVTVLDEKQLASGGYGGILGVGQGSARPPRLVKIAYAPAGPAATVGLIGKGITFDSGGISLKPGAGMKEMTMDMAGAAAVLHTVVAAARLPLPVAVTGYLCLAENMPGGNAQRPGDVATIRGGKTVEVDNTDAEGRLVMADGLVAAIEDGHETVIDIATLTGAQMVALGTRVAAFMGTDDVRDALVAAADAAGEKAWPMPIPEEMKASLKSNIADMVNVSTDRWGGMLFAGAFLREFVGETPWGHMDIAGPAWNGKGPYGYTHTCGTGYGVRTLVTYLEGLAC